MDNGGKVPERVTLESLREKLRRDDPIELRFVLQSPFFSRHTLQGRTAKNDGILITDYSHVDDSFTEDTWTQDRRSLYGKSIKNGRCFFDD